jgi:hypothetical protein
MVTNVSEEPAAPTVIAQQISIEAVRSSETLLTIYQTTQSDGAGNRT